MRGPFRSVWVEAGSWTGCGQVGVLGVRLLPGFLASQPFESQRRLLNGDNSLAGRGHPLRPRRVNLAEACPLVPGPGCLDLLGSKASPLRSSP